MAINIQSINKLKNLPKYVQILISTVPSVILILLFIILVLLPRNDELQALNTKKTQLDREIASSITKIKRLDILIEENKLLKKKLARLKEQLPEEKEVSILLKQISELGLRSGLEILLWKPEARKTDPEGLYVEIPVKVEVMAEYHMLGVFFSHISRLPRLVNISDISLSHQSRIKNNKGTINATFTARTFASMGAQDIIQSKDGKQK